MKGFNFTAIDFETANETRSSACSIGLARVVDGVIVEKFHSLIKPDPFHFNPINVSIHGIKPQMCVDAPTFSEIWNHVEPWISGQILVGHNVSFECSVLNHLYKKQDMADPALDYLCTMYMSKVALPNLNNYKLPTVYRTFFDKDVNHHDAIEDAIACAEIAMHIMTNWLPPSMSGMTQALYEKPREERKSKWNNVNINTLVRDRGYENDDRLKGYCVCFTNELTKHTRAEAAQFVVNRGGKVATSITKSVTTLVIGSIGKGATKKLAKVEEINQSGGKIKVLNEEDFLDLISTFQK